MGILFLLMILFSTYDKFGFLIPLGSRSIHFSPYKVLFIVLVILYAMDYLFKGRIRNKLVFNQQLYRFIWIYIILQTITSLLGSIYTSGTVILSSEIYYLIQRSTFIFIPLLALRCRIKPISLLKLFLVAIIIHYAFILLQFISPALYRSFAEFVYNPIKSDHTRFWGTERITLDFIGLQSSSNYGTFTAAFGLLMLPFIKKKNVFGKLLAFIIVFISLFIVFAGPARAVFIMGVVTLFIYLKKTNYFSKLSSYYKVFLLAVILIFGFSLFGTPKLENFFAIDKLVNPEIATGSNIGKWILLYTSYEMVFVSPIVGWGQQRFLEISSAFGNTDLQHFHFLSILVSTGLIGFTLYLAFFYRIVKSLWQSIEKDYAIVCAMYIGLFVYNLLYDAGHLDVFACFNGVVAYYALLAVNTKKLKKQYNYKLFFKI